MRLFDARLFRYKRSKPGELTNLIMLHLLIFKLQNLNNGVMPQRALKLVNEWRLLHINELMEEWKCAEQRKTLFAIKPLE
jgi:hypothetical protein